MKRHHIKTFQSEQYKVAALRIADRISSAWAIYISPDYNMKFDYEKKA